MPQFYIRAVNCEFDSRDDGADYASAGLAMAAGVRSALDMAREEMSGGQTTTAVEISIEQEDGTTVQRSVLAMSVSPLMIARS